MTRWQWLCALVFTLLAHGVLADAADGYTHRTTAIARASGLSSAEGKPERIDFNFNNIKGWLRHKGDWHVGGTVAHNGLRCGTYELGMRFGVGQPGCTNVQWLTDVVYGTRQRHCNGATRYHDGGGFLPELTAEFNKITCAERVIQCTGNCK